MSVGKLGFEGLTISSHYLYHTGRGDPRTALKKEDRETGNHETEDLAT